MNANTVTIITAPAGGATAIFGSDMARVLDDGNIRVLPVLGKGPVRNVLDILYLKSIDMGMVAGDVPEFYRLQYKTPDITSQLRYICKLYNNELHVVASTSVKSIYDLDGKRIVAQTDVGYYSAKVIFSRLNMNVTYDYWTDDARAIQKIVDGEADAYITSTGKIFGLLRAVKNEDRKLHLCRFHMIAGCRIYICPRHYPVTNIQTCWRQARRSIRLQPACFWQPSTGRRAQSAIAGQQTSSTPCSRSSMNSANHRAIRNGSRRA